MFQFKDNQTNNLSIIEKLYSEMQVSLFKYAYFFVQNENDAGDALQNAIIKFIKISDKIEHLSEEKLRCYLKKIVKNESHNILRSRKSKNEVSIEEVFVEDIKSSVADNVEIRLDYNEAVAAVKSLSPNYATFIYMKYFEDLPDEVIAAALGVKIDSLRMISTRARRALKTKLYSDGGAKSK